MKNLFERTNSYWVKYDRYEYKEKNNILYITPADGAEPKVYDPLKDANSMVVDALNIGMLQMKREEKHTIRKAVMDFVTNYGLLGFMTALPTTPSFMDYEAVYLPKNHFIKSETMTTQSYLDIFYPFQKIDVRKKGIESTWNVYEDKKILALMMTFADQPQAMNMSFQREYAERYDWILLQFKDWAFTLATSEMYYSNDRLDDETKMIYKQAISAFGGITPTYHISFYDKPTIVWDFHSLLLGIQLMFSMMLADETTHLKLCKNCMSAFVANRGNVAFCCSECKDNYNVKKNRSN